MRHARSVSSVSWIPSEAITGSSRVVFDMGVTHYDDPPPETIHDLQALRAADRFRFANDLRAWIDVDEAGTIVDHGYAGGGLISSTQVKLGGLSHRFQPSALPDVQAPPEVGPDFVRFVQTTGGRTGLPAPRRVRRKPFVQWQAPLVWTTLSLTIYADGRSESELAGASRFPRHWVYDNDGQLTHKSGLADFKDWWRKSFGRHTPWGDEDSEALVTVVETALERTLSAQVMRGGPPPRIRRLKAGSTLVAQGDSGTEVFLVLDGVLRVERDGERMAEYGPGALLGERAHLEKAGRTSSLIAVTRCTVASVEAEALDRAGLEELAEGHRREDSASR
jgi:hypothetical protein